MEMLQNYDFEKELSISKEIADGLKSEKSLNELKNGKICLEGDRMSISSWTCDLSRNLFFKTLKMTRVHSIDMEGGFELGPNARWKAVPDRTIIADFPPFDVNK